MNKKVIAVLIILLVSGLFIILGVFKKDKKEDINNNIKSTLSNVVVSEGNISGKKKKKEEGSTDKVDVENLKKISYEKQYRQVEYKLYDLLNNFNSNIDKNVYDLLNNAKMILLRKFDSNAVLTYVGVDQLLGNYNDIKALNKFLLNKYKKSLKDFPLQEVYIKLNRDVDNVYVNGNKAKKINNKLYEFKGNGLIYLTIKIQKKGCIPGIYKLTYRKNVVLNYECVPMQVIKRGDKPIISLKNVKLDVRNIDFDYLEYGFINQENGSKLGVLNLPVISKDGKILSNAFTTYGMPYIKFYKDGKVLNKCIVGTEQLINYDDIKEKVLHDKSIQEKKWYSTETLNRKIGFGWRNLNENKGIWTPGEIMFYDKNKGIIKFKYCYVFSK